MYKSTLLLVFLLGLFSTALSQSSGCSGAPTLAVNATCSTTAFTISNGNSGTGTATCASGINDDAWYQFTALSALSTVEITGASNNIALVVYSGTCAGLTEIHCDDQGTSSASVAITSTIGVTYYVRVIRTSNGGGSTTGNICVIGYSCGATTVLDEQFESSPVTGAITANIYGGGSSNHNGAMIMSGTRFGWFNVVNGLGNVDLYDRSVNVGCVGYPVDVSFWTRESYGSTNVTFSVIDDLSNVLATNTMTLTGTYQQITYNFYATTPGLRFVIHCNSTGGSGIDICVEDLLITQCCPITLLPVEFAGMSTSCTNEPEVHWSTLSETNSAYYTIERSSDGEQFEFMGETEAAGNSQSTLHYSWTDDSYRSGEAYYRLSQTDFDGATKILGVIALNCSNEKELEVFPNPTSGLIYLRGKNAAVSYTILSATGKDITHLSSRIQQELELSIIDLGEIPSGLYFLRMGEEIIKLTVQ